MQSIKGLTGTRGQACGIIVTIQNAIQELKCIHISESEIAAEEKKLNDARKSYQAELSQLYEKTRQEIGENEAAIFRAYLEMVNDDVFFDNPLKRMKEELINIEYTLNEEKNQPRQMFLGLDDLYMKERGSDIENVCNALIDKMLGSTSPIDKLSHMDQPFIIIAEDLAPADTVRLDKTWLRGFITEKGGQTSHTVILAKTLGIPAIVGAKGALSHADSGKSVWMNGETGEVVFEPDQSIIRKYKENMEAEKNRKALLREVEKEKAFTLNGQYIKICVNAGQKDDINSIDISAYDGIGLFRTEFLYMAESDYPTEETQFQIYKNLAKKTGGKETIIRTLDIGGDKSIDYMQLPEESNPFLGYRAIRICLDRKDIFKTQLRAILRASVYGHLSIMFPMIVNLTELRQARHLTEVCMQELARENIPYDGSIRIGIMIETPAAVLISDILAREADFFSIGTNDLIQYITASDRMNEKTQYLYSVCCPSVLRAIRKVVQDAHAAGIQVGICGEAASDERMVPIWVSLGIDELSMVSSQTAAIKYIIRNLTGKKADAIKERVFQMDTVQEIEMYLDECIKEYQENLC